MEGDWSFVLIGASHIIEGSFMLTASEHIFLTIASEKYNWGHIVC